ncbi:hypothetical protein CSUB01_04951 [Colletotrichum sublineola]|uniref:Apple domain-containing protein n=1 Tax=Colletotrichum sublineola TaxID=1173701 RepID=A0A066XH58_COLSU|nr:hypothetical protein CSUB01_04951 [Colletotrichum sublineola]
MVFTKSVLMTIILAVHIANAEESALEVQLSQSPPRTVTAEQGCYTDFGQSSRDVQTYSRLYSYTFPVTEYTYTTPTTSTITITPTISAGGLGTTTSTVTTTTHVTSFTTVTVAVPARFTPISAAIVRAGGAYGLWESPDGAPIQPADVDRSFGMSLSADEEGNRTVRPVLWPQAVVCEKVVRIFTTTTSTITATRAATTTTTLPGPTQQTTVTMTTTTTSTITDVAANPTRTVYEACQTNNLQEHHGQPRSYFVEALYNWFVTSLETRRTDTPENCCVACQTTPDCNGSLYHLLSGTCYIFKTRGDGRQCQSPAPVLVNIGHNNVGGYGLGPEKLKCLILMKIVCLYISLLACRTPTSAAPEAPNALDNSFARVHRVARQRIIIRPVEAMFSVIEWATKDRTNHSGDTKPLDPVISPPVVIKGQQPCGRGRKTFPILLCSGTRSPICPLLPPFPSPVARQQRLRLDDDNHDDHEAVTASTMAELDPNAWYRLSETRVDNSTGPFALNLILRDVGLRVHPMTDGTAAWQFQPFGDVKGRYLMRLDQAGVKQQLGVCYDAKEPAVGATVACLQESSVNDSQIWEISPWSGRSGEYKFVNVANGTAYVLDVHPKANLFMNRDVEGSVVAETQPAQHWVISSVSAVNDGAYSTIYSANVAVSTESATLSTASKTTLAAATTSAPTTTAASQAGTATSTDGASISPAVAVPTSKGISPGAGAGIGVGVAIGVVGLIGAIAFFWWRRQQAAATQYSEVDAKNRGSPGAGSSSAAGSPEAGSYALPYGVQRADASYPGYSRGSPATLSYSVPVRGGGASPATMNYPVPATATSPSESRSLRSWSQHASASGLAVPAAVPRHQFDHPDIHNEFAPAPSNPSFESTTHLGFSTTASSQANSTTNLNDPDPLPSAHELEVAVRDMPRRQHELGDFHHGPETFDISREAQPARAPAPHAELGAFQHGPDTFAQSHEAKMLGLPPAELGSYHHGPDTFADGHEDKMLGGCPPGAEKFQREREDKVLGSFHEVMNMAPNGRSGRQPGPSDAPGRQAYEMQPIGPR